MMRNLLVMAALAALMALSAWVSGCEPRPVKRTELLGEWVEILAEDRPEVLIFVREGSGQEIEMRSDYHLAFFDNGSFTLQTMDMDYLGEWALRPNNLLVLFYRQPLIEAELYEVSKIENGRLVLRVLQPPPMPESP